MTPESANLRPVTCPKCHQQVLLDLNQPRIPNCPACGQNMKLGALTLRTCLLFLILPAIIGTVILLRPKEKHVEHRDIFNSKIDVEPHSTFWSAFDCDRPGEAHMNVQAGETPVGFLLEPVAWQAPTQQQLDLLRDRQQMLLPNTAASVSMGMERGKRCGFFVINETDKRAEAHVRVRLIVSLD